nr:integrase, catalytic region, zinc finger, CCHC-type, peptidase aspartic, catalytic [Tanacetum cinerariifolium]
MIPKPSDPDCEVPVAKTFHVQSDEELPEKEVKKIEADDQAIQTILMGIPEDIYAAVDKKKAKLFNAWERFTSTNGESIESYYHRFLKLMNDLKRNKYFPEKIASNLKFLNNLQPEWSRHVTIVHQAKDLHTTDYTQLYDFLKYNQKEVDELKAEHLAKTQDPLALLANSNNPYAFPAPHQDQPSYNQTYMKQPMLNPEDIIDLTTAINMALALMAKAFKLNYSTPTNNNQRISSNPRNRQIAQLGMNMGQDRQMQMVGDLDEIEEVNANCILMANLQQASTSGCSNHITKNLKLLINFVWKFMGTVHFGNDHVPAILGFSDLQWGNILITMVYFVEWGNILISRVYFVEGLGHNLFLVGQFCNSDLEVAFRRNACFVRNLEGVDLLKGDRSTNLYTINLQEMASASPICLMNDREDIGKLGAKSDIGFFIGYSADSCAYKV